jgi:hypothetical protein
MNFDEYKRQISELVAFYPQRPIEAQTIAAYWSALSDIEIADFVAACGQIANTDEWFPTAARLRSVADECKASRSRTVRAIDSYTPRTDLVCPRCHGARWIRLGGYDPLNMLAGDEGSRVRRCPDCTDSNGYSSSLEGRTIAQRGGVPDPNGTRAPEHIRWTVQMPRRVDGRIDMDAIYRESRVLRKLDPNVDARLQPVAGFSTFGSILAESIERETTIVAGRDDDVPF